MKKVAKKLGLEEEQEKKPTPPNVIPIQTEYQVSEEDVNRVLGRHNSGDSYPEEFKNVKLFHFYEKNGFREIGDTRLLFKTTDD